MQDKEKVSFVPYKPQPVTNCYVLLNIMSGSKKYDFTKTLIFILNTRTFPYFHKKVVIKKSQYINFIESIKKIICTTGHHYSQSLRGEQALVLQYLRILREDFYEGNETPQDFRIMGLFSTGWDGVLRKVYSQHFLNGNDNNLGAMLFLQRWAKSVLCGDCNKLFTGQWSLSFLVVSSSLCINNGCDNLCM